MSILNYFFIGVVVTFVVEILLESKGIKNHPSVVNETWGVKERIICVLVWPLAAIVFVISFIKETFKK